MSVVPLTQPNVLEIDLVFLYQLLRIFIQVFQLFQVYKFAIEFLFSLRKLPHKQVKSLVILKELQLLHLEVVDALYEVVWTENDLQKLVVHGYLIDEFHKQFAFAHYEVYVVQYQ